MAGGLTVGDCSREISIDGPLWEYTSDDAEWRTEIGWPIFRAGAPA